MVLVGTGEVQEVSADCSQTLVVGTLLAGNKYRRRQTKIGMNDCTGQISLGFGRSHLCGIMNRVPYLL